MTGEVSLPPQSYFVAGNAAPDALPEWDDYGYGTGLGDLGNVTGNLGVRCGQTLIDEVKYTVAGKSGSARIFDGTRVPDSAGNDNEGNWCDAEQPFTTDGFGSPRTANAPCGGGPGSTCRDPSTSLARAIVAPTAGQLVITEVMANPGTVPDADGEWFEVLATTDVDLNGLVLGNGGTTKTTLASADCLRAHAGQYLLFAHKTDALANGGLPLVTATFNFSLANAGGTLTVRTNAGGLIDQAPYGAAPNGIASQLNPEGLSASANDQLTGFCPASAPVRSLSDGGTGDLGTPGAANSPCSAPPDATTCHDLGLGTDRLIVAPEVGDLVITELMPDPTAVSDTAGEWFEVLVKNDRDFNGVVLTVDSTSKALLNGNCLHATAGSYVLFAKSTDSQTNGGLPAVLDVFNGALANTGSHTISLLAADGGLRDSVTYTGATSGRSWELGSTFTSATDNDTFSNFCAGKATFGLGDQGTPGAANESCP